MSSTQLRIVAVLSALLAVAILVMGILLGLRGKTFIGDFVPPVHDTTALQGMPQDLPEAYGYIAIGVTDQIPVKLCTTPIVKGNQAYLYFSNPSANAVSCRVRITDTKGNLLGESGLINPGEYVESIALSLSPTEVTSVVVTVLTYRENYLSAGTITVAVNLTPQQ